ncbi:YdbH domain-containing protein [Phenylobacterium sp. J367]|uniref:YdbH domain-containing protein n=1 Tax=Phenylobacterium sp. J367 TaxID=2898435 RepID=UPI0021507BE8|nr:YdbH domain-containing protein [Phenylobacterium sp. J367]MCR5877898.1 YdbH domain-containing protein [Phenylobacterium sp. J367]
MTDPQPPVPVRRLRPILAAVGVALVVLLVLLYASRRVILRESLTGWLESKGIPSEAEVEAFGLTSATARIRIGDPANPDFTAERAVVGYSLRGLRFEVTSVRLTKPVLRARLHNGKLSVGSLDPLIEEFRQRPPRPDAAKPRIEIDDGVVALATDYGPVRLTADARVEDNKLLHLVATSAPARLQGDGFEVVSGRGAVDLVTRGARTALRLDLPVTSAKAGEAAIDAGRLRLTADVPYPDLQTQRNDGRVVIRAELDGRRLQLADQSLTDAQASAAFTGESRGWISDLILRGRGSADVRAGGATLAGGRSGVIRASVTAPDLTWTRKGGDALAARFESRTAVENLSVAELRLATATATARGTVGWQAGKLDLRAGGGLNARGGWMGLGLPTAQDSRDMAAVKRAARSFQLAAPAVELAVNADGFDATLAAPVRLIPAAGGEVRLAPQGSGWRLTAAGGGLPKVTADVRRFQLTDDGARADGRVQAALGIGPVEGGVFDATGTLRMGAGGLRFSADRCANVQLAKLELGENDVEALAGRFCPAGEPLLTLNGGDWRLAGRGEAISARVPFLQVRASDVAGRAVLGLRGGRLYADATIAGATVADTAAETRFNPVRLTGKAALARDVWDADLVISTPAGQRVATADLFHSMVTGQGGVDIETGELAFADGGLQPDQLSPLAANLAAADGTARFTGGFRWTIAVATSGGSLTIPRLDFTSPAGRVTGLSGKIDFASLAPLVALPGQELRVEAVAGPFPLTGVTATFGLAEDGIEISGGEAAVGGGKATIESVHIPLLPGQATRGVLNFEGVQLHDIVEASPFGDKVDLDAKVSGRIPFEMQAERVRILGGSLRAIQPGRLSIQRSAITGVSASTAIETPAGAPDVPPPPPDTFTDFAYQAMENLAFDTLEATVASREDGRLGVLFHIVGRHDPPQKQEIRLGLMDLIRRNFLNRQLPLPSGTGVNLTLDTTLNLDDLLKDYADYQRLRSSPPVQP